jgi:nitric oxide reductase large subunit
MDRTLTRETVGHLRTAGTALLLCGIVSLLISGWFVLEEWSYMRDNPGAQLAPVLIVGGVAIFVVALGATIAGFAIRAAARSADLGR